MKASMKKLFALSLVFGSLLAGCMAPLSDGEQEIGDATYAPMEGPNDTGNGLHPDRILEAYFSFGTTLNAPVADSSYQVTSAQHGLGFSSPHAELFTYLVRAALPSSVTVYDSASAFHGEGLLDLQGSWLTGTLSNAEKAAIRSTVWALTNPYGTVQVRLYGPLVADDTSLPGSTEYHREAIWSSYKPAVTAPWKDVVYIFSGTPTDNGHRYCGSYTTGGCNIERVRVMYNDGSFDPAGLARFEADCASSKGLEHSYYCNGTPAITSLVAINNEW